MKEAHCYSKSTAVRLTGRWKCFASEQDARTKTKANHMVTWANDRQKKMWRSFNDVREPVVDEIKFLWSSLCCYIGCYSTLIALQWQNPLHSCEMYDFSLTGSKTFESQEVANNAYTGFKIVHQASRNADRRNWMRDDEQRWVNSVIVYWSSINNRLRLRTNSASNPVAQAN